MKLRDIDGEEYFITFRNRDNRLKAFDIMQKVERERVDKRRVSLLRQDYVSPYDTSMAVAQLIYIARKQMGYTHEELAEITGISYRRLLLIESGNSLPWKKEQYALKTHLGIDPALMEQELERAGEAIRKLTTLNSGVDPFGRKEFNIKSSRLMKRIECFIPPKVRRWIEAEAAVRGVGFASFASLLIMIMYRTAMDSYLGNEDEFEKVNGPISDVHQNDTYLLDVTDSNYFDEVDDE